jgi:hypothetical protein
MTLSVSRAGCRDTFLTALINQVNIKETDHDLLVPIRLATHQEMMIFDPSQ